MEDFEQRRSFLDQIIEPYLGKYYVLVHNDDQRYGLTKASGQWELRGAYSSYDSRTGRPAVDFNLDSRGANRFGRLTGNNKGRQLAIFLDGVASSHATIQSAIYDRGQITGNFTEQDVQDLVSTLEAGSLPARLKPTPLMENSIGPSLGETNRAMGTRAAMYGLIVVAIFILVYYLFAGLVANVALALNLLFVLAIMATLEATFTLPGIAGLILTVGMAVDANVLIFERLREERARGLTLKKALKTAYEKAFSTIVDANLTTLITCVILGYVGSEEVKGFAMTLGFGVVTSMFTALFVTRMIFMSLISARVLHSLPMLRLVGVPSIQWLRLRSLFWPMSMVAVIIGIAAFTYVSTTNREKLYDIEFLGGTSLQIELKPGVHMDDEQVRTAITGEADSAVAWLASAADALEAATVESTEVAGRFKITSDALAPEDVVVLLTATFEDRMARGGVTTTENQTVVDTKPILQTKDDGEISESRMDLAAFQAAVTETAEYVRQAANTRLRGARVQTVRELGETAGAPEAFEIVTVETSRDLVQAAVVAVLRDKLQVQLPVEAELFTDEATRDGFFPIEEGDRYLDDVVPGTGRFDIQEYKGGLVLVFDKINPPQTTTQITDRIREVRLLPEYEDFEYRPFTVLGLTEAESQGDEPAYSRVALIVVDENIYRGREHLLRGVRSVRVAAVPGRARAQAGPGRLRQRKDAPQGAPVRLADRQTHADPGNRGDDPGPGGDRRLRLDPIRHDAVRPGGDRGPGARRVDHPGAGDNCRRVGHR
jgi:protein-export membrane protein SecD